MGSVPASVAARHRELGRLGGDWRKLREEWNRLVATETVKGEVPASAYPLLVTEIQRSLDVVGHASIVGGTMTWSPAAQSEDTRKIIVQVAAEGGETRVRIREELGVFGMRKLALAVGGFFGAAFGGTLAQAFAMTDPGSGLAVLAFAGAGVLTAVRAVVGIDASGRAPELEQLARTLAELGREAVASRASLPGPGRDHGPGASAGAPD